MQAETLDFLGRHPDVGELHMWETGALPLFPTGKRPPNQLETVALRDFAQRVNQHRHSKVKGAFVPGRLNPDDPLTKGEYTASYHGPKHPAERIFRSNFEYADGTLSSTLCDQDTKVLIHSHPIPVGSSVAGETQGHEFQNRIRMPSMVDHLAAAEARMRSGADNYLVFGSQVFHYNGKDLAVTELVPSPLNGRLPYEPLQPQAPEGRRPHPDGEIMPPNPQKE